MTRKRESERGGADRQTRREAVRERDKDLVLRCPVVSSLLFQSRRFTIESNA